MTAVSRSLLHAAFAALLAASLPNLSSLGAQSPGEGRATKQNLDLPYDALGVSDADDDPLEIVTFYDTQLEGDGFFYIIDRSKTMQDAKELDVARAETIRDVTEFSERVQFGIFFFDKGLVMFPASGQAAEANPGMKASAISFVQSTPPGEGTCQQAALSAALRMANRSSARRCVIVYLSDGGGTCMNADEGTYLKQALAATTAQNYKHVQINTIGVLDVGAIQEQFLRSLASSNGGTYTRINRS